MKVCWFSTGISSFVACYLAKDVDEIIYTHVSNQHPDSLRFLHDYMQFIPENQCSISAIEKGIFACYEIKSCKEDIYSGNGLNFIGEKNYLVTTMECYKEILPDLKNGKFAQHIRENFPECYAEIGNMGVMVAVPYQRDVSEEFENPTPLDGDVEKWKLSVAIKCNHNGSRKRSMTELLFCMVRSGH